MQRAVTQAFGDRDQSPGRVDQPNARRLEIPGGAPPSGARGRRRYRVYPARPILGQPNRRHMAEESSETSAARPLRAPSASIAASVAACSTENAPAFVAPKGGEVCATAEGQAQVVRQRPHVEASAAHDPEAHQILRTREQRELVDRHLRRAATRRTDRTRASSYAAPSRRPSWPNRVAASAGTSLEIDPARRSISPDVGRPSTFAHMFRSSPSAS